MAQIRTAKARTILIVDGDQDIRASLAEQFGLHPGFAVRNAATGAAALAAAGRDRPDLVLLAMSLPDAAGCDIVRRMRAEGYEGALVVLAPGDREEDAIGALDAGADDVVGKPVRFAILLARVRAHLRQRDASEDATLPIGDYNFHPRSKRLVSPCGATWRLTEKEVAILRFLHRAAPAPVRRDVLLREVWGYGEGVSTHTLETHVYRLRRKIGAKGGGAGFLRTEEGGYRLVV